MLIVEGDTEQVVLKETLSFMPQELSSTIKSDWHIVRARGKAVIASLVKYFKAIGIEIYVIHDGDYGKEGAEKFNPFIKNALNNDSHLCVLNKCIEDVLGYEAPKSDKPLAAYQYIKSNWNEWNDISEAWRNCIEKVFCNGNHIVIKTHLD